MPAKPTQRYSNRYPKKQTVAPRSASSEGESALTLDSLVTDVHLDTLQMSLNIALGAHRVMPAAENVAKATCRRMIAALKEAEKKPTFGDLKLFFNSTKVMDEINAAVRREFGHNDLLGLVISEGSKESLCAAIIRTADKFVTERTSGHSGAGAAR